MHKIIIFTTLLTPETFCYESKVKWHRTIKNSQVSPHKVQQKSQLTVNANPGISSNTTLHRLESQEALANAFYKNTTSILLDLNVHKPNEQSLWSNVLPVETSNETVEQSMNIELQGILSQKLLTYENRRIFYDNFLYIRAIRRIGDKDYWSNYKVIKLVHYPPISRFTRKHNGITYQIPDKYEVETSLVRLSIRCKTQYQQDGNINYMISWINSCGNTLSSSSTTSVSNVGVKFLMDICNKSNTRISGISLFGFDIDCLHKARIETSTNRKHPYTELKSNSQKKQQIVLVANDLKIQVAKLFHNHQFINSLGANIISLELVKLRIADQDITLNYQLKNKSEQYYNSLVRIYTNMIREYLVEQQCKDISNQMEKHLPIVLFTINQELEFKKDIVENRANINVDLNNHKTENAVYRLIKSLLMLLVPILTVSNPVVLYSDDKINLKISGDDRNISRK
ncbi:23970_t:CDS:2 [Cetraspora pellucida]|uniref:23970_t:CDS:1 n=1 Tax=Cetraspora pellucida TaxID=1433469 RepID=A0A9N8W3L7_9GLOM|nr:23970_t:CDS:2 [Cetraspora pellucida]